MLSAVNHNEMNNDPFSCGSLNELIALTQDSKDSKTRKQQQQYNRSDFLYPGGAEDNGGISGIKNTVVDAFKH